MPVRRMTFLQAVDYFNSLQNEESDNNSDDDFENANPSVEEIDVPTSSGDQEHVISQDNGADSDLSDGEIVIDEETDDSDSEADASSNDENSNNEFVSPNGVKWNSSRPVQRRLSRNITNFSAGPTFIPRTEVESFYLFLDETILRTILTYTNRRVRQARKSPFTLSELKAGLAILIRAGADKDNLSDISTLFNINDSRPFYRCAMSKNRFKLFLRYISFDNKGDRRQRQVSDKMAAIREVWELFQSNLRKYYVPTERITVDEQLYGYRGYAPGRCYMKSKPAKYGVKFYWLCDAENGYALSGTIYSGKSSDGVREVGIAEKTVLNLSSFYFNSGRNVFIDRYFTSRSLCCNLLQNGLTMTGTISANRRDVPKEIKTAKQRSLYSTVELWDTQNRILLLSYIPKKGKNVLMMTSCHSSPEIQEEREDKKPLVIHDYNQGKGGVDLLDSCIEDFTTKRKTNRYTFLIFSTF